MQGKQELAQRLVREFPKVFQIAPLHCTPEYGQEDQVNSPSEDVLADHVVSANDFQVSLTPQSVLGKVDNTHIQGDPAMLLK